MKKSVSVKSPSNVPGLIVLGLFAVITGVTIFNHIMWRDEWQAILISYKCDALNHLWRITRDEGHPILWFFLLYITKFFGSPLVIPKIVQYLSALSYCSIILFYAPFPRIARYALVFTYFFLFEYAVITRDYGISLLLIFSLMALWKNRHKHKWAFALLLFLLAQSTFYAAMMAGVFVLILISEPLLVENKWQFNSKDLPLVISGIIGVILSYLACERSPLPMRTNYGLTLNSHHLTLTLDNIYNGFIPIPEFTHNCWNSILPDSEGLRAFLSIVILAGVIYFLRSDKRALLFFIAYVIAHELFSYFYIIGFMRHSGYLFIAAVVAFWFYYLNNPKPQFKLFHKVIIGGVLAIQVVVALFFIQDGLTEPFTESAETASWLHDSHLDHLPIYGNVIYCTTAVSGYLDKPIIDVNNLKPYSYAVWGDIHYPVTDSMLRAHFQQILSAHDSSVLLLDYTSPFISQSIQQGNTHIIPLKLFANSNMIDENFYVFLLKR